MNCRVIGRPSAIGLLFGVLATGACTASAPTLSSTGATTTKSSSTRYEDLLTLFADWRAFQQPKRVNGVPDYSASAMSAQQADLKGYIARLEAIDSAGWSIPQQVDYYMVRAEMNGLDFDHRVLRPWTNNPAFYVTVYGDESDQPAREGPMAAGGIDIWPYSFPLSAKDAGEVARGLSIVPALLEQAKTNLTGRQRDLWTYGTAAIKDQSAALAAFGAKVSDSNAELKGAVDKARAATDALAAWLDSQASTRTEPSGVGVDNYNWYLKNVQLVPYTWQDELTLMQRELTRSSASLAFEEQRHAGLPQQVPIASAEEHDRKFNAAVTEYMKFLSDHDLITVRKGMDPGLRKHIGSFSPGPREFFGEVDARDPEVMRTHGYHWFDKDWLATVGHASPIRKAVLLYNIFNTRTEGFATAWEEMMMQAGMFDARPRSRELVYILVAERGARAIGDLKMHSREFTLEQAAEFASANTPRGWLSLKGNLVRGEQFLYLQQPGYGTSYVIGKVETDKLITARRLQLGDQFTFRRFMDEFNAAGLVPISLLRWELTGQLPDDVKQMLGKR